MKKKYVKIGCFLALNFICLFLGMNHFTETNNRTNYKIEPYSIESTQSIEYESDETTLYATEVVRIVDGDTLVVNKEGVEEKVRIIGINTPESVSNDADKNCTEGVVASDYVKSILTPRTIVYMEYDQEKEDIYGRTLSYIWLTDDVDTKSFDDFCTYNLGAIILENTYCEAVYYAPNGKYKNWYEKIEEMKNNSN